MYVHLHTAQWTYQYKLRSRDCTTSSATCSTCLTCADVPLLVETLHHSHCARTSTFNSAAVGAHASHSTTLNHLHACTHVCQTLSCVYRAYSMENAVWERSAHEPGAMRLAYRRDMDAGSNLAASVQQAVGLLAVIREPGNASYIPFAVQRLSYFEVCLQQFACSGTTCSSSDSSVVYSVTELLLCVHSCTALHVLLKAVPAVGRLLRIALVSARAASCHSSCSALIYCML
jgi:hypothetical protein